MIRESFLNYPKNRRMNTEKININDEPEKIDISSRDEKILLDLSKEKIALPEDISKDEKKYILDFIRKNMPDAPDIPDMPDEEEIIKRVLAKIPKPKDGKSLKFSDLTREQKISIMGRSIKGDPGEGVPPGGATGQSLVKKSNADFDTEWQDTPEWFSGSYNDLSDVPNEFPPEPHTHDDRYYTETETDSLLDDKADLVGGKVPSSQLPSYVDDVIEWYYVDSTHFYEDTGHTILITPETGKIYVSLDTSFSYRWSWSSYIRVSSEADTLQTVTDRDNNTTNDIQVFTNFTEKLTNGSFTGSSSWWSLWSWWTYSANAVHKSSNGTKILSQSVSVFKGGLYKLTYTISNWTVGTVTPVVWWVTCTTRSSNGTYTQYVLATNNSILTFTPSNTARFTIDSVSLTEMSWWNVRSWNLYTRELIIANNSNNTNPGTTRHISLQNQWGASYIDAYFWNTLSGALWWKSSGVMELYANSSMNFNIGVSSPQIRAYLSSVGFFSYWMLASLNEVAAWSHSTAQPSTLTSWKSFWAKHTYLAASITLDSNYTYVDWDADSASACSGTPTYPCSHWTNQTDCEKWDAHGWCSWSTTDCSSYSYTDEGTCEGNPGCTWDELNCSEWWAYDEYSCTNLNSSYGWSCAWNNNPIDCSTYNPTDQFTCESYGCSWYDEWGNCSSYWDESSCLSASCYWDWASCVGSCSGSIDSYSCDGTYFTGNCSGSGWACIWSSNCAGIDDSTNCGFEGGCSWTTWLSLTLPSESGFSTNFMRSYFIRNIGSSANLTLYPNSGQTVNGTTSLVIWPWKARHVSLAYHTLPCSTWDNTNSVICNGHSGCSYTECSWLDETSCWEAWGNCVWNSEFGICEGNGNCTGTNTIIRDWSVYGWVF